MLEQWQFPVADNDVSSRQNTDFFFFFLQNSTDAAGLLLLFFFNYNFQAHKTHCGLL